MKRIFIIIALLMTTSIFAEPFIKVLDKSGTEKLITSEECALLFFEKGKYVFYKVAQNGEVPPFTAIYPKSSIPCIYVYPNAIEIYYTQKRNDYLLDTRYDIEMDSEYNIIIQKKEN